jgi:uncharacterized membrane protein YgcG
MGYVIAIVIVMLIVAAFVAFMVLNATRSSAPADPEDPGGSEEGNPAGIVAPDDAPLGDTSQHAGEQEGGRTVGGQDAERSGGTGRPQGDTPSGGGQAPSGGGTSGGEGGDEPPTPESERLANRPR